MNRIQNVLEEKGIEELRPSKKILNEWGVTYRTWNMWVKNQADPRVDQLVKIAEWLQVPVSDLIVSKTASHA